MAEKTKKAKRKINEAVLEKKVAKKTEVKEDKKYKLTIDLKGMLSAGCHLGHKISKTHPKAKVNIYTAKDGIQIFDLTQSFALLEKACNFIYNAKRSNQQVIIVGTKRQAREAVRRVAKEAGVYYVTDRWLGGTISNWEQIKKTVKRLAELRGGLEKGTFSQLSKREQSEINKEASRLEKMVGGLVGLERLFDVLIVVDAGFEKTAVREAKGKGLKIVALVDTDSDPSRVDYPIPVNDDSAQSINLIIEEIGKAIKSA